MLLTAVGLALWDSYREMPGLARAGQSISWLAGATLLIGFLLAWVSSSNLFAFTLNQRASPTISYLILMAALAAPARRHRRPSWSQALSVLPALVLNSIALFWIPGSNEIVTLMGLMIALCGGLGARALGQAVADLATQTKSDRWPIVVTYGLLTSLLGVTTLMNLWRYGTVWSGGTVERHLTGVWMFWSAAQIARRQSRWLRDGLTVVAALLLIVLAVGCQPL